MVRARRPLRAAIVVPGPFDEGARDIGGGRMNPRKGNRYLTKHPRPVYTQPGTVAPPRIATVTSRPNHCEYR